MTKQESASAMLAICERKITELSYKSASLPSEAKLERKSLEILKAFAHQASEFAKMGGTQSLDFLERRTFAQNHYFDSEKSRYDSLDEDARGELIVYLHGVTMLRRCFLDKHRERLESESASVEEKYESRLVCGILDEILAEWKEVIT